MPAREPIRMRRAKAWNVEVENAYRFQCAGWRSAEEYAQGEYGDEISWFSDSGLVEKVQNRQGLFMYFKRHRECLDKYLPRVKIFEYANDGGHK
mmetsp:Transcript_11449/g.33773  ORF Transcript_11449/g.33773 Transcript_11449/m.33773 type:complete len:94 (+) Transcript_11449:80-361(+)